MRSSDGFGSRGLRRKNSSGLALVIVLASLVFLVALGIAFLLNSTTELKSSKTFSEGGRAKMLAQTAVSLAMAQISDGTKGVDGSGNVLAWASQPGMIRTYDASGNAAAWYKLYSWDVMTSAGAFNNTAAEQPPSTWYQQKALFTDLNEPATSGTSKLYPIIDGNKLTLTVNDAVTGSQVVTYDDGTGVQAVDGFYVSGTGTPKNPAAGSNPVPMPVKWLYVLKQGQLVAPSGGSGNTASFSGANVPSDTNPIVGRVAFWTDDESCKININTASEGVYWDTPRIKSKQDDVFKINQPVAGEYQRYPGHPAMTSLSTVIKHPASWNPGTAIPTFNKNGVQFTLATLPQWIDFQWAQELYGIVPRIGEGGSFAGSVQTAMLLAPATPPPTVPDVDRLYASVDELVFRPDRSSNNAALANQQVLDKATLERDKFFLTASSRAPDVNLFNRPRVCIWPLADASLGASYRTAYDKLIAFCTTVNGYGYYFQRNDPTNPTTDLNVGRNGKLLSYLRNLAGQSIPGFGGNFSTKYPSDSNQIVMEIFDYIRCTNLRDAALIDSTNDLNSHTYTKADPTGGWKAGIPSKPYSGQGQVVPIADTATNPPTRGFGRFPTIQGASVLFIGQVDGDDPLVDRNPTNHTSIVSVSTGTFPTSTSQVDPVSGMPLPTYSSLTATGTMITPSVAPGKVRVQAMFLPQFFCPAVGSVWYRNNFQWRVDLSQLTLNGAGMGFPAVKKFSQSVAPLDETGFGDQLGIRLAVQGTGTTPLISAYADVDKASNMTLAGKAKVEIYDSTGATLLQTVSLNFTGVPACPPPAVYSGTVTYDHVANRNNPGAGDNLDDPNTPVNGHFGYYYLNYRCFSSPITGSGRYNNGNPDSPIYQSSNINTPDTVNANEGGRIQGLIGTRGAQGFIVPIDAIRSVRLVSGDGRLVAGQTNPPDSLFEPNPTTDKLNGAHHLFTGYGQPYYGAALGKLVKGAVYDNYTAQTYCGFNLQLADPAVASSVFGFGGYSSATDVPTNGVEVGKTTAISTNGIVGDFDNAPFDVRDGPYINKADEGDYGIASAFQNAEPYEWKSKAAAPGLLSASLFTPNRQVPSAVTFGSLPTGINANRPWQTLLFHPEPGHPGSRNYKGDGTPGPGMPADDLWLDFFHLPVVEPYAISEPLSTAGRINMNYQILPFGYINRDTGIRALLKSEKVIAISNTQASVYKARQYSFTPAQQSIRLDVNQDETLKGFLKRFNTDKDIFRSASEICELPIVPIDPNSTDDSYNTMATYWQAHQLTGDNSKERIYATLYPRLTTKSNTFTVHFRVQALKKVAGSNAAAWDESRDRITGEFRGSQTVERYIDPNNSLIPDYANLGAVDPISTFYKFRVVLAKQFSP